jgi:hypothetical protein
MRVNLSFSDKNLRRPQVAFGFAAAPSILGAILLGTVLLCGCPGKKQWTYAPPSAPAPSKDFDVSFDAAHPDPNGAARNVDWAPQLQGRIPNPDDCNSGQPYSSSCTQNAPFQDEPSAGHQAFCWIGKRSSGSQASFFGHADWMIAQYDGSIGWFNLGDDFDYGLMMVPGTLPQGTNNEHGITSNNNHVGDSNSPQYMEMEIASDEVDDVFTGWWDKFQLAARSDNDAKEMAHLFHPGKEQTLACGTALGLFGLDCDHGCRSELHPVYALAIQRTEDPSDNEWSVMVRNWGTGGYCSQYNDELAATSLSLVLPYNSSQPPTSVEIQDFATASDSGPAVSCPKVYFQNGQTILNVTMPPPGNSPVAAFTLKIQWPAGAHAVDCPHVRVEPGGSNTLFRTEIAPPSRKGQDYKGEGEGYMGQLLRGTKQGRRVDLEKDILPTLPTGQVPKHKQPLLLAPAPNSCRGNIPVIAGVPPAATVAAVQKLKKDPRKQARDDLLRSYICRQYRTGNTELPVGSQKDFDQACKGVK